MLNVVGGDFEGVFFVSFLDVVLSREAVFGFFGLVLVGGEGGAAFLLVFGVRERFGWISLRRSCVFCEGSVGVVGGGW